MTIKYMSIQDILALNMTIYAKLNLSCRVSSSENGFNTDMYVPIDRDKFEKLLYDEGWVPSDEMKVKVAHSAIFI